MTKTIRKQIKLPVSVAFDVVWQGIRIRLGRSVVTLMGVVFGIAFLMAMLTGQMIRQGVSHENEIRAEVKRMMSFLTAEIGPLKGRTAGVIQVGPLSEVETRFFRELGERGGNQLRWTGGASDGFPIGRIDSIVTEVGQGAVAILVAGAGTIEPLAWDEVLSTVEQKVVAVTRTTQAVETEGAGGKVVLARELREDEVTEAAAAAQTLKFRTVWIIVISLMVTVIGITNAMLMSVTERFREIGTMKCLGALSSFIRQVFFIEASLLGVVGSVIGCVGGIAFSAAVFSLSYGPGLVLSSLSLRLLLMQSLFCIGAGVALSIVAAIYPASVASRMVPAVALRSTV